MNKKGYVFKAICVILGLMLFAGCAGAEDTPATNSYAENAASDTFDIRDGDTVILEEDIAEPEPAPAVELTEDFEYYYAPVIRESLEVILHGYRDEVEYNYFSAGLMEKVMYEDRDELLETIGYSIQDMSGDGIAELLIGYDDVDPYLEETQSYILEIYTLNGTAPYLSAEGMVRSSYRWLGGTDLAYQGSGGAMNTLFGRNHLSPDGMQIIWDDFYFSDEVEGSTDMAFYHNTEGAYNPEASERLDISYDEFIGIMHDYRGAPISWTPIGTYGYAVQNADGEEQFDDSLKGVSGFKIADSGAGKVKADLDGDGTENEIKYRLDADSDGYAESLTLYIEDKAHELTEGICCYAEYGLDCYWFRNDERTYKRFLYIQYVAEGDYIDTAMYRYNGQEFIFLDMLDGEVAFSELTGDDEYEDICPTDPEDFLVKHTEEKLGTQSYTERCRMGSDGRPVPIEDYKYYMTYGEPYISATKMVPCMYMESEKSTHEIPNAVWEGNMVTPFRTDGETFIDLKVEGDTYGVYRIYIGLNDDGRWRLTYKEGLLGSDLLIGCFRGLEFEE